MANIRSITGRMIKAAKLDIDLYKEVEADSSANGQAFAIIIIVSMAGGLGFGIYNLIQGNASISMLWWLLQGLISTVVVWLLSALVTYLVGTSIFKTKNTETDYGQLLRTIGFAFTPGILSFFVFIPYGGYPLYLVAVIWIAVAVVIAVKQSLDFSVWRAIGTCIVSMIPFLILYGLFLWLFIDVN